MRIAMVLSGPRLVNELERGPVHAIHMSSLVDLQSHLLVVRNHTSRYSERFIVFIGKFAQLSTLINSADVRLPSFWA